MNEDTKETEETGKCQICGNATKFYNIKEGVYLCCSRCTQSWESISKYHGKKIFESNTSEDT